ncbi:modifier of rudimentary (Mod(R)) protein (macronuclear) [Tetrahymena thermophila SB210]|uniref:Modifier of rudimentary (Mod(R)) protein n=1 Tax=Tetrahymena thermophila (strain SB210) TaxID=312017 RepID=Q22B36_TETTS|nr:modifier of rudimentary (Mod(R)) protein [Tetrahymena thermophila SB210]EAR82519.2 modifier of rudimentary (Mod(R)) protein [Tetrahymena thermophila SB210]|eukprot:XP_001030182.2 modifier of rudimentary (Mod(R)) protein [Tetrahymena thermophila SB210]
MNYNYQYGNPNVVPMALPKAPASNQNTNNNNPYNPYAQNQIGYQNNQFNYQQQQQPYAQQQQQQQQPNQYNPYSQQAYNQYNPNMPQLQQQQQQQQQPQAQNQQQQPYNQYNNQYQQQKQQNPQQNLNKGQDTASVQNQEIIKQLDLLKQRFPYQIVQPQFPSEVGRKTVINMELDIPNFKIPIKIELDFDFPRSKPSVFLRKRYIQANVNDSTLRFMYEANFRWEQNSTLINLITTINQMIQQNPPFADGLLEQFKEKKETINQDLEKQKFATIDVQKVFPGQNQQQLQETLNQPSFAENIAVLPEVIDLKNRVADLANLNVKVSSDMIDQQASLEVKKINLNEIANQYEQLQQQLQKLTSISNNIKERFGDMSIIQALGQKISELEENSQNVQGQNFEEEVRNYKNNRQLYHMFNTQREKLTNSN